MVYCFRCKIIIIGLLFLCSLSIVLNTRHAWGQDGPVPVPRFYVGYDMLNRGDFRNATQHYQNHVQTAVHLGASPWIDSICYYSMLGETFYMAGNYERALECFNASATIYLAYPNWLARTTHPLPYQIRPRTPAPWGSGNRRTGLGFFPGNAGLLVGDAITEDHIRQGGAMSSVRQIRIDPLELLGCMALTIRRRNEIMGPMSQYDPMTHQILGVMSTRTVPPNHWSIPWLDVLFGMSLKGVGKRAEARDVLINSLSVGGQADHNLTAVALFELGEISMEEGKALEAASFYFESSISAWHFSNYLLIEESLRHYAAAKRVANKRDKVPVLYQAFQWSRTQNNLQLLQISLSEELAENLIIERNFKSAGNGLRLVERMMTDRTGLRTSRYADRWNYLSALLFYAAGRSSDGDVSLGKVVEGMKIRSPWYFQVRQLDTLATTGGFTSTGAINPRSASELYTQLYREPTDIDWLFQPMDSLVVQSSIPTAAFERWFLLLLQRDLKDQAFDVAERLRRERFYASQQLGGRLISLRYLLTCPETYLSDDAKLRRQNIYTEFPEFAALTKKAEELSVKLHAMPIAPKKDDDIRARKELVNELATTTIRQESQLRFFAASRIGVPTVFPPPITLPEIQAWLGSDTSILAFVAAGSSMYGFMITNEAIDAWRVGQLDMLRDAVAVYLKSMGCIDGSRQYTLKELAEMKWTEQSRKFLEVLLGDRSRGGIRFSVVFKHLVVIPDHSFWYLPFETLSVPGKDNTATPLLHVPNLTVRYAATAGLAIPGKAGRAAFADTVVIPGTMFPRVDESLQKAALTRLSTAIDKLEILDPLAIGIPSSFLAARIQQLIVFDELGKSKTPGSWAPFVSSPGQGNELPYWISLPWGAPKLIVLPGLRTPAENALKLGGNGFELFASILALQSTDAETILLTRWRTGGRTTYDLVEQFMKNVVNTPVNESWKKAVETVCQADVIPAEEPRLRRPGKSDPIPKADHPFFWGGFMLVDRGEPRPEEETGPAPADGMPPRAPADGEKPGMMKEGEAADKQAPAVAPPQGAMPQKDATDTMGDKSTPATPASGTEGDISKPSGSMEHGAGTVQKGSEESQGGQVEGDKASGNKRTGKKSRKESSTTKSTRTSKRSGAASSRSNRGKNKTSEQDATAPGTSTTSPASTPGGTTTDSQAPKPESKPVTDKKNSARKNNNGKDSKTKPTVTGGITNDDLDEQDKAADDFYSKRKK